MISRLSRSITFGVRLTESRPVEAVRVSIAGSSHSRSEKPARRVSSKAKASRLRSTRRVIDDDVPRSAGKTCRREQVAVTVAWRLMSAAQSRLACSAAAALDATA